MPRTARIKSNTAIYHVIMRSISDFNLFKNNIDKNKYLQLIKKYKQIHMFKLYAFCLMDTHVHLLIDSNGADISTFMHKINQCYAQYYNKKYKRNGHVFGDRFKSKIATTDVSVMCISAYIHNNPKDIRGYQNFVKNYNYSSFGIYLGKKKDIYDILDYEFLINYFSNDPLLGIKRYYKFVKFRTNSNIDNLPLDEFNLEKISHSHKAPKISPIRKLNPNEIIKLISNLCDFNIKSLKKNYSKDTLDFNSLCIFFIHILSNTSIIGTCRFLHNINSSNVYKLFHRGYNLIYKNNKYNNLLNSILKLDYIKC
ncbi:transposase [Clostridium sp. MB40-C1]|uniref:transposase n=1 Tax=Clostridium sp. MB40-C1 TaxID=3070996 RepID=UPI0027DF204E|nr:transposase [Clostridium sp. MB40-C1]WMJ80812.1 transposase [Clostridium sp. MB40-C1]